MGLFSSTKTYTIKDLTKVLPPDYHVDAGKGPIYTDRSKDLVYGKITNPYFYLLNQDNNKDYADAMRPVFYRTVKLQQPVLRHYANYYVPLSRIIEDTLYFVDIMHYFRECKLKGITSEMGDNADYFGYYVDDAIKINANPTTQDEEDFTNFAGVIFDKAELDQEGALKEISPEHGFYVVNYIFKRILNSGHDAYAIFVPVRIKKAYDIEHAEVVGWTPARIKGFEYSYERNYSQITVDMNYYEAKTLAPHLKDYNTGSFLIMNNKMLLKNHDPRKPLSNPGQWRIFINELREKQGRPTVQEEAEMIAKRDFPELYPKYHYDFQKDRDNFLKKMQPLNTLEALAVAPPPKNKHKLSDAKKIIKKFQNAYKKTGNDAYNLPALNNMIITHGTGLSLRRIITDFLYFQSIMEYLSFFQKKDNRHYLVLEKPNSSDISFRRRDTEGHFVFAFVPGQIYYSNSISINRIEKHNMKLYAEQKEKYVLSSILKVSPHNSLIVPELNFSTVKDVPFYYYRTQMVVDAKETRLPPDNISQWKLFINAYRRKYNLPSVAEEAESIMQYLPKSEYDTPDYYFNCDNMYLDDTEHDYSQILQEQIVMDNQGLNDVLEPVRNIILEEDNIVLKEDEDMEMSEKDRD